MKNIGRNKLNELLTPSPFPTLAHSHPSIDQANDAVIDPILLSAQTQEPVAGPSGVVRNFSLLSLGPDRDGSPAPIPIAESAPVPSPKTVPAKRGPIVDSPPKRREKRTTQKRKIMTQDDLALIEAQKFLGGQVSKRTKRQTRRRD